MSEIQDEACTEAIAEISRLRARIENMMKNQAEGLRIRDQQIAGLKALLIRALDALEKPNPAAPVGRFWCECQFCTLIHELRHAAQ
jgi:hypothetical protein